ncbi:MAG: hypothetical protein QOI59_5728 [Gammaproteobacteria bacterium]|nr:hypothetical protein [Gammaproteobacteria bacterium]
MKVRPGTVVILLAVVLSLPVAAAPVSGGDLLVTLEPAAPGANGLIPYLDVIVAVPVADVSPGQSLLRLPLVISNVQTVANELANLEARDAIGPVELTSTDDSGQGKPYRRWRADRSVRGSLSIRYRVPITNIPNPRGAAPPLELRSENGAFSAEAATFLVMPDNDSPYHLAVHWDFSSAPRGRQGLSTVGFGDVRAADAAPAEKLEVTYFMGGLIQHFPDAPARSGFLAAWQGVPPFDTAALMKWTETLYGFYLNFFRAPPGRSFGVFLRPNPINAGGGVEIGNSFVGTFSAATDPADLKLTLAHEMVHAFVHGFDEPESMDGAWYAEGLAVYYQRVLPLRAGLISSDVYLRDINTTAGRYFTDAMNRTPNDRIQSRFWADTRIRVLPYDRGSLYFAQVDAAVRKASHDSRSLDDLVLEMLKRRHDGLPVSPDAWVQIITRELGQSGRAQFEGMLTGTVVIPPSDSFGACYERTTAPLRRYDLGFTTDVLAEPGRIVRDLEPGSAAALAGLRNGDHIVKPVPQDAIQADQHALLHLQVQRGDKTLDITYLPRGETVEAYQWKWVDHPPASCMRRQQS